MQLRKLIFFSFNFIQFFNFHSVDIKIIVYGNFWPTIEMSGSFSLFGRAWGTVLKKVLLGGAKIFLVWVKVKN
jgi:hypothetical protein